MTTSIPHALLARLDPLQGLGEEALAQIGRKARRLPLNTRQKLASSDVHRWLVYLVEGAGELNCGGQGSRLDTVSTRALSPLFTAGDTAGAVDASIKYLFAYPTSHAEADKRLAALRAYLAPEADLVDIRALLRTHCQVLRN